MGLPEENVVADRVFDKRRFERRRSHPIKTEALLLLAALIWGVAFVAQKSALSHVGPFTFIATRFSLSALLLFPLAWLEERLMAGKEGGEFFSGPLTEKLVLACVTFSGAIMCLQVGIGSTSVANAGFISGLYVLFVPILGWVLYKQQLSVWIFPSAILSIAGIWFLSGGNIKSAASFGKGDILVLCSALGFALNFIFIKQVVEKAHAPFRLACLEYGVLAILAAIVACTMEHPDLQHIKSAWLPIVYAGVMSGAIAFTIEIVVIRYVPAAYSAVILSTESVFAALAGILLMNEHMTSSRGVGCLLIIFAVLLCPSPPQPRQRRKTDRRGSPAQGDKG